MTAPVDEIPDGLPERQPDNRDSSDFTPFSSIKQVLKDMAEGKLKGNKALFIFLDDRTNQYEVQWHAAGLDCAESLALTARVQYMMNVELDYPPEESE